MWEAVVGGLIGLSKGNVTLLNSFSTGVVRGGNPAGLVGLGSSSQVLLRNSYAAHCLVPDSATRQLPVGILDIGTLGPAPTLGLYNIETCWQGETTIDVHECIWATSTTRGRALRRLFYHILASATSRMIILATTTD